MPEQTSPGAAIRTLRNMAGLTLQQVAERADTAISYLSKVERGELTASQDYVARVVSVIADAMITPSPIVATPVAEASAA